MRLEKNLGVKVLRRSTRAVSVTAEGRALYTRTRRALDELDAAEEEAHGGRAVLRGPMRIAIPGGACSQGILKGIACLSEANPELRLEILVTNAGGDPVRDGFEVVLHVGELRDSLIARRLTTVSWLLAAAPSYFAHRPMPEKPSDRPTSVYASPPAHLKTNGGSSAPTANFIRSASQATLRRMTAGCLATPPMRVSALACGPGRN